MARAALSLAILLAGCGLASKDFEVVQPFQAGGGLPSFSGSFNASQITGPLSGDVGKISSITLKAARIEATDGKDLSFISDANISASAGNKILATALLAKLAAAPPAGATSVELVITAKELKPFLETNGTLDAGINYAPTPVTARALRLVLTLHGTVL